MENETIVTPEVTEEVTATEPVETGEVTGTPQELGVADEEGNPIPQTEVAE